MPARSSLSRLSEVPPYRLSRFAGHPDTLRAMVRAAQGVHGEQSLLVRMAAEEITRSVQPKDYLGEMLAIRYWVTEHVRYLNDPLHVELIKTPERLIRDVQKDGTAQADCDEMACLIGTLCLCVGREAKACVVGFGGEGDYSHVFGMGREPRSGKWIVLDPVAGTDEKGMLSQVTTYYFVSFDEPPEQLIAA